MKPEVKVEDGKLKISLSQSVDGDADGKAAAAFSANIEVDGAEALDELMKDGSLLDKVKDKLGMK